MRALGLPRTDFSTAPGGGSAVDYVWLPARSDAPPPLDEAREATPFSPYRPASRAPHAAAAAAAAAAASRASPARSARSPSPPHSRSASPKRMGGTAPRAAAAPGPSGLPGTPWGSDPAPAPAEPMSAPAPKLLEPLAAAAAATGDLRAAGSRHSSRAGLSRPTSRLASAADPRPSSRTAAAALHASSPMLLAPMLPAAAAGQAAQHQVPRMLGGKTRRHSPRRDKPPPLHQPVALRMGRACCAPGSGATSADAASLHAMMTLDTLPRTPGPAGQGAISGWGRS